MDTATLRTGSVLSVSLAMLSCLLVLAACADEGKDSSAQADIEQDDPNAPGVREVGPNQYVATIFAFEGGYQPAEIRVPAGAEVTFRASSRDQPHGFLVEGTEIELDVFPGQFAEARHTFTSPGRHRFFCQVYCGAGHEAMQGRVIVQ